MYEQLEAVLFTPEKCAVATSNSFMYFVLVVANRRCIEDSNDCLMIVDDDDKTQQYWMRWRRGQTKNEKKKQRREIGSHALFRILELFSVHLRAATKRCGISMVIFLLGGWTWRAITLNEKKKFNKFSRWIYRYFGLILMSGNQCHYRLHSNKFSIQTNKNSDRFFGFLCLRRSKGMHFGTFVANKYINKNNNHNIKSTDELIWKKGLFS